MATGEMGSSVLGEGCLLDMREWEESHYPSQSDGGRSRRSNPFEGDLNV